MRFGGRLVRRFFVALGVLVVLAIVGYVEFEAIVEAIDSHYADKIDAYLGIDRTRSRGCTTARTSPSNRCSSPRT